MTATCATCSASSAGTRTGRRIDGELPIDLGVTPAAMFDRYVELYREIAEQADGVPAPGQFLLPGVA